VRVERIDRPQVLITGQPPEYQNPGDAGMDLVSTQTLTLEPGARALVPTGVAIALPQGYVGLVTPRSGLALKHGISMVNAPGVIDAGYRGEIGLILWNTDRESAFTITEGDRIGQLLVMRVAEAQLIPVDSLPGSTRGMAGFGSTGVSSTKENS
jgi:dUTP pyrophosphatase